MPRWELSINLTVKRPNIDRRELVLYKHALDLVIHLEGDQACWDLHEKVRLLLDSFHQSGWLRTSVHVGYMRQVLSAHWWYNLPVTGGRRAVDDLVGAFIDV